MHSPQTFNGSVRRSTTSNPHRSKNTRSYVNPKRRRLSSVRATATVASTSLRPTPAPRASAAVASEPVTTPTDWRWTFEDRQKIVEAAEGLDDVEVFPVSKSLVEDTSFDALRLAAARHGADALLIVDGGVDERSSTNGWAVTYAVLLPLLFAPAGELDTVFEAQATMFDVRNGYLYMTAESGAQESQERAHVWIDAESAAEQAKVRAVDRLVEEVGRRLTNMLEEPREASTDGGEASADGGERPTGAAPEPPPEPAGDVEGPELP